MTDASTKRGEMSRAETLGVLVKETQSILNQRMDEVLRPLGLTVPQYACITALRDTPGISGSELARRTFVSRQSVNVLLKGLEEREMIVRADTFGPRGKRAIDVTPKASALLDQARPAVTAVVDRMTGTLTSAELDQLTGLLRACRDGLRDE